jgi:hypothetical protein
MGKQSGLVKVFLVQLGFERVFLVQLGFHQTPKLKCTIMTKFKYYKVKSYTRRIEGACLAQEKKKS